MEAFLHFWVDRKDKLGQQHNVNIYCPCIKLRVLTFKENLRYVPGRTEVGQ